MKPKVTEKQGGVKRKLDEPTVASKQVKSDGKSIISEEERRRQDRDSRSLFIKEIAKKAKDAEITGLVTGLDSFRRKKNSNFGWLVFNTVADCKKAHDVLSKSKIQGKALYVDFCLSESKAPKERTF